MASKRKQNGPEPTITQYFRVTHCLLLEWSPPSKGAQCCALAPSPFIVCILLSGNRLRCLASLLGGGSVIIASSNVSVSTAGVSSSSKIRETGDILTSLALMLHYDFCIDLMKLLIYLRSCIQRECS